MRVSAISMAGLRLNDADHYSSDLSALLKSSGAELAVLPAYSALMLGLAGGALAPASDFTRVFQQYIENPRDWNNRFMDIHSRLARNNKIYLAAGTLIENDAGSKYHSAYCLNPKGEICGSQRQTHLTRVEREIGLSRGGELNIFYLDGFQAGLVVGNDARHPEVGRIYALRGAGLLLYSGALEAGYNCWPQAAGMWAQAQQNQFWTLEAQLSGTISGCNFGAPSAVIGPCEITPGKSGYLSRGYPHTSVVTAELDEEARRQIKEDYPLLELLNVDAYSDIKTGLQS